MSPNAIFDSVSRSAHFRDAAVLVCCVVRDDGCDCAGSQRVRAKHRRQGQSSIGCSIASVVSRMCTYCLRLCRCVLQRATPQRNHRAVPGHKFCLFAGRQRVRREQRALPHSRFCDPDEQACRHDHRGGHVLRRGQHGTVSISRPLAWLLRSLRLVLPVQLPAGAGDSHRGLVRLRDD